MEMRWLIKRGECVLQWREGVSENWKTVPDVQEDEPERSEHGEHTAHDLG